MTIRTAVEKWRWWIGGALVVIVTAVLGVSRAGGHEHTMSPPPPVAVQATTSAATTPAATTSAAATESPSSADCVTQTIEAMSLSEKAGQVLMIGTAVDAPSGLGDTVARYHLGGVFLHGRSTQSRSRLSAGIAGLQKRSHGVPLLISLDQEGGQVQTLKGPDFPRLPSALKLGSEPAATIRDTTAASARRLAGIGVTVDLAPVADTVPAGTGDDNPPIGGFDRQFGSDPRRVAASIRTVVGASQDAGVLTVLKHFPGLGRVHANTDTSAKAVDATTTAGDPYLQPFAAGIQAGTAGVMMSSASYPRLDPDNVAAFSSSIITGLLRTKLGFDGLIMSDDLGAAVAVAAVPAGDRAVRFVAAGGDAVLTIKASDAAPMAGALLSRAQRDAAFAKRLTAAATHVLEAKEKAGILRCG